MNREHVVEWTFTARDDLWGIVGYIAEQNRDAALDSLDKIEKRASELSQFPEQGRIVPELYDLGILQCRELVVSPWRIIYKIAGNRVLILAVFDGRRNLEDALLERFRITNA